MNTIGKYIRFIFKNLKAFRASKRLYAVRTHLALANMEISKISLHDQHFARAGGRVQRGDDCIDKRKMENCLRDGGSY